MKLVELEPQTKRLRVRFSGADFRQSLEVIHRIPTEERFFDSQTKYWSVLNTEKNVGILRSGHFKFNGFNSFHSPDGAQYTAVPTPQKSVDITRLSKEIRPFQIRGVEFLEGCHGIAGLWDDQGLGKTMQACCYTLLHPEARPALIVCPKSVKINWSRELLKWGAGYSYDWPRGRYNSKGIFILNYDQLHKYQEELLEMKFALLIADEIQYIKSPKTLRTKAFVKLARSCPRRIFLSGTPIKNKPREFWTALNLLNPQEFRNQWYFLNRYCGPDFEGATNIEELRARISGFTLRRTKEEVLKELPPKQKFITALDLEDTGRASYGHEDEEFLAWTTETNKRLQQQQYIQLLLQRAYQAKRDSLIAWIQDFLASGQKLVLFGYHREVLLDLERCFPGISVRVDGSITGEERQKAVDAFQGNSEVKLFIGQIHAAGVGLTLTAASTVAFVQLWYVPADLLQCEDRLHRIGQEEHVQVYYLPAEGTLEDDIAYTLEEKYKMVSSVLDGREDKQFFDQDFLSLVLHRRREKRNGT